MVTRAAWQVIRENRVDLTDYVIHFTDSSDDRRISAEATLLQILRDGMIKPSFSRMSNRHDRSKSHNTIKGPDPAVCLTEMPLWCVLKSREVFKSKMGFGVAYHKRTLYEEGGRPVIYGDMDLLGKELQPTDDDYIPDRVIYSGGILPPSHQYLWVMFDPHEADKPNVDFTWEREWRIKVPSGLPVVLKDKFQTTSDSMIIVERESHVEQFRNELVDLRRQNAVKYGWVQHVEIISLEAAKRQVDAKSLKYYRIDTWPREQCRRV
jgi:hypothetical protein